MQRRCRRGRINKSLLHDRELAEAVLESGGGLKVFPNFSSLRRNRDIVLTAYRNDREIARAAVANNPGDFVEFSGEMRCDKEIVLLALGHQRAACEASVTRAVEAYCTEDHFDLSETLSSAAPATYFRGMVVGPNDRMVHPHLFCSVTGPMLFDLNLVCAVLRSIDGVTESSGDVQIDAADVWNTIEANQFRFHGRPPPFVDKQTVLLAVERGLPLRRVEDEFLDDYDVVSAAVARDGTELAYASQRLRGSEDQANAKAKHVVLTAVRQNGRALQFASDELKGDREVVLAAVTTRLSTGHHRAILEFAAFELQVDPEVKTAAREAAYESLCGKQR